MLRVPRLALAAQLALALALALPGGCSDAPERPLDIVVIVVDTLRADHLPTYGYERATAPALAAFAEQATVFERAYAPAPWTKPSVATLLTSLPPRDHGVSAWEQRLPGGLTTLAQHLAAHGYRTEAYVSHHALHPQFSRFQRGFDVYDVSAFEDGNPHEISSASEVSEAALVALDRLTSPSFLWLHYFDPHEDYLPQAQHVFGAGTSDVDLYDGEIAHTDAQIGRVLDALAEQGRLEHTVVVVTADHGEEFGDHGGRYHGQTLYDEVLRVPLIVHAPGLAAGRIARTVGLVDVAPTVLALAGVEPAASFAGRPVARDDGRLVLGEDRPVFVETRHHADLRGVVLGRWKLVQDRRQPKSWALFDLVEDPGETRNVMGEQPDVARSLRALLKAHGEGTAVEAERVENDAELQLILEQLGYTR